MDKAGSRAHRVAARAVASILAGLLAAAGAAVAQAGPPPDFPVTKVTLYSSGVGYFEHRGTVTGDATIALPFKAEEVNDALKSLVVWDAGGSGSPSVSYPSQESLDRALKGFRVDLSGFPRVADLLARLRGVELSVDLPETVSGKIVGVESRPAKEGDAQIPFLVLLTKTGVRAVSLDEVVAFRFADPRIADDFERALGLILSAKDSLRRVLDLRLPGSGPRPVSLGYVVPAPVWKVSYRLDLSSDRPFLQGWAIVDNPTDQDWRGVSLSLVSGRPVSFVQDLYAPLYLDRPIVPLAIAGAAAPRTFESGLADDFDSRKMAEMAPMAKSAPRPPAAAPAPPPSPSRASAGSGRGYSEALALSASASDTAIARSAGDLFEFTVRRPVTLERRRSAMIGLVAGDIAAERVSVFSPDSGRPMLGARIVNSTGMKLPAGPITVFDAGVYAGDALIDFLPEKEKRLVVFGTDLSVVPEVSSSSSQETVSVVLTRGQLTFSKRVTWTRSYAFKNSSGSAKKLVVEHPRTSGAELVEPKAYEERTESVYRFLLPLPASSEAKLVVKETSPSRDSVALSSLSLDSYLSYSSSKDIPAPVREALKKAMDLKAKVEEAKRSLAALQTKKNDLAADQGRIRQNLGAVGRDTSQGQQYLKRLMDSETELDSLSTKIEAATKAIAEAQTRFDDYLGGLSLQ